MTTIAKLEARSVCIPLQKPVQLGPVTIAQRDYVVVKLVLSDGSEGYAYGYDRGLPLFDLVAKAARYYPGEKAADRNRLRKLALGPTPAPRAAMVRGMSLCDIALWDAWCVSVGQPLSTVLGAVRDKVPVMPVIGYGMTPERAATEGANLAARGFKTIKCMIDGLNFEADKAVMEALAASLPTGVKFGIDAHWSWTSIDQALPWCRLGEKLGGAFVEDPFAPTQVHAIASLSSRLDIPLAVGEDVIDLSGFRDLANAGGILRVDASVSGGITGAVEAIAVARAFDRPVIPHVFAALHAELALAFDAVRCVEMIMPEVGADPIDQFFLSPPVIEGGNIIATGRKGAGLALDWDRVAPYTTRQEIFFEMTDQAYLEKWGQSSLDHTGWITPDIERSVAFWTNVMGFEAKPIGERRQPWISCFMGVPNAQVKLVHLHGHGGHIEFIQFDEQDTPSMPRGSQPGAAHICLRIKNVEALRDDILRNGGSEQGELTEITEGIAAGLRGLYMRDPHGVLIELVELPRS